MLLLKSINFNLLSEKQQGPIFNYMTTQTPNKENDALGHHVTEGYDGKVGYLVVC